MLSIQSIPYEKCAYSHMHTQAPYRIHARPSRINLPVNHSTDERTDVPLYITFHAASPCIIIITGRLRCRTRRAPPRHATSTSFLFLSTTAFIMSSFQRVFPRRRERYKGLIEAWVKIFYKAELNIQNYRRKKELRLGIQ